MYITTQLTQVSCALQLFSPKIWGYSCLHQGDKRNVKNCGQRSHSRGCCCVGVSFMQISYV